MVDSFSQMPLAGFIAALAAATPTPGGGSAAAAAIAVSAGLVEMVAGLSGRKGSDAVAVARWHEKAAEAHRLRLDSILLVQQDSDSYQAVIAARRLPERTAEEAESRTAAVRSAVIEVAEVPWRSCLAGLEVLRLTADAAVNGNPVAITDAGTAGVLALAGIQGASMNVRVNLSSLTEEKRADFLTGLVSLEAEAEEIGARIREIVKTRLDTG